MLYGLRRAATLRRHAPAPPPAPTLPATVLIVTEGDSITNGLGATGGEPGWPGKAVPALLAGGPAYTLANVATSGITVTAGNGINYGYPSRGVAASFDPGKALNVLTVMCGTNDGAVDNRIVIYRGLRSVIRQARATGYQRIAIGTLISRSDGGAASPETGGYFSANVLPLNQDIRALWNSDLDADGLIDFGAGAAFDQAADADSTTYYTDKLHPKNAGYSAMAAIAAPVIDQIVAAAGTRTSSPATFSPFDKDQFLVLSNGNRTVGFPNGNADASVRGFPGRSSGKWYWEMGIDNGTFVLNGVMSLSFEGTLFDHSRNIQNSPSAIGFSDHDVYLNGALKSAGDGFTGTLAVQQHCIDATARRYWVRNGGGNWNGSATANPATGAGGIDISAIGTGALYPVTGLYGAPGQVTARFAAAQMTGAIPSGFAPLVA